MSHVREAWLAAEEAPSLVLVKDTQPTSWLYECDVSQDVCKYVCVLIWRATTRGHCGNGPTGVGGAL
jgi:hypothetical protein